jgi:hypothetical protein
MISIAPEAVTPAMVALFDRGGPTMPRALNVLAGAARGQILVDDPARPAWAAVREDTYGTLYLGGQVGAPLLGALVDELRKIGDVGIGCWPDSPLSAMLPSGPQYDGWTLFFPARSPAIPLEPLAGAIPSGYSLTWRDARWLARSPDADDILRTFGSAELALRHTRGVVLHRGEELACEAATGAPTLGRIEVGVTTDQGHRQRGLATVACAALIMGCEAEGLSTWWDCAAQNVASARLARRLGYTGERQYRYVWWPKHE